MYFDKYASANFATLPYTKHAASEKMGHLYDRVDHGTVGNGRSMQGQTSPYMQGAVAGKALLSSSPVNHGSVRNGRSHAVNGALAVLESALGCLSQS
jgi:hypothetical protein